MDTEFMNFRDEERFPLESHLFFDGDDSTSLDGTSGFSPWEWENEQEINGDRALIPTSSHSSSELILSNSPPSKEDFQKIMCEWQQMINIESNSIEDLAIDDNPVNNTFSLTNETDLLQNNANFDITKYIDEPNEELKKPKIGGKKIDILAQRYIIDDPEDDNVDVETISECNNSPVLQANDLNSLLEQFEASETLQDPYMQKTNEENDDESNLPVKLCSIKQEIDENEYESNCYENCKTTIKEEIDIEEHKPDISSLILQQSPSCSSKDNQTELVNNNKQIIEALPQELIMRIKESGKRKPISVIPAIPNKRRGIIRTNDVPSSQQIKRIKIIKTPSDNVQLDHNYCSLSVPYPKHPKKDSGFESSEDDERSTLRNQPTIKNINGKLMVSVLKVNNMHHNANIEIRQKRKLNLEEYKKRREGIFKSNDNSMNNSPANSGCNSPVPEDENTKIRKHQEKLMRMASEILKTPIKSKIETFQVTEVAKVTPPRVIMPPNMEVKTFVSIGVNTITDGLPPVKQLEEIKPILESASVKINCNSLITSLIENIPKIKDKSNLPQNVNLEIKKTEEHGEDKTIVYLPKNRKLAVLCDAQVQTESEETKIQQRHRRRKSSSDSSTSSCYRRRNNSTSSQYSSTSSSRSSSRSRSRSISPWRVRRRHNRELEKLREVEERRVVYVGRISSTCTRDALKRRFDKFGPISNVSVHFREHGDNYGFVTFLNKLDAYEAVEHGNDEPYYPKYDLSFGGRRIFCKTNYSDLDNMREDIDYYPSAHRMEDSFDDLLKEAQEKLRKRKA